MKTIILSTFGESNYYIPDIMLGAGSTKRIKSLPSNSVVNPISFQCQKGKSIQLVLNQKILKQNLAQNTCSFPKLLPVPSVTL